MRTKEHLALIPARDGRLTLTTLLFADEVRPTGELTKPTKKDTPSKKEVDRAVALIDALSCPWDPSRYEDRYQTRLKRIVRRKQKGQTVEAPKREKEPSPVPDLMAALEETLARAKAASGRRRIGGRPGG